MQAESPLIFEGDKKSNPVNGKNSIQHKIIPKVSAILVSGGVLLILYVACYHMLQLIAGKFTIENTVAVLVVCNILLLCVVVAFLIYHILKKSTRTVVWKPISGVYLEMLAMIGKTGTRVYKWWLAYLKPSKDVEMRKKKNRHAVSSDNIALLQDVFPENARLQNTPAEAIGILSYFATSLFDKNKLEEVLWDIVENCISQLKLEDCVIYVVDPSRNVLVQKAAFGNKNNGEKKVISTIEIVPGEGVVGKAAQLGEVVCVPDLSQYPQYIVDDASRLSELAVPVFIDDEVVGVLDAEHSQKNFFTATHIFLFQLIAKLTGKKLQQIYTRSISHLTNDNVYFKELNFLMKEAKIYREPYLGLDSMAQKLNISSNYLSQLVNKLGGCNFTDYVSSFRIEDAKSKLRDPRFVNYTVIDIALESGFNSKSTFYSTFKKMTGISPNSYRQMC